VCSFVLQSWPGSWSRTESSADRRQTFRTAPPGVKPGPYSGRRRFTNLRATSSSKKELNLLRRSPLAKLRASPCGRAVCILGVTCTVKFHLIIVSDLSLSSRTFFYLFARRCDDGLHGTESFPFYWTSLPINRKRVRAVFDWIFITFLPSSLSWRVIIPLVGAHSPLRCNPAK